MYNTGTSGQEQRRLLVQWSVFFMLCFVDDQLRVFFKEGALSFSEGQFNVCVGV